MLLDYYKGNMSNNLDNEMSKTLKKLSLDGLGLMRYKIDRGDAECSNMFQHSIILDGSTVNASNSPSTTIERTGGLPAFSRCGFNRITFRASAGLCYVASSSALDTSAGTGARTLYISGLDSNWDLQTDSITMNGQTPVATNKQFLRINALFVSSAGSTQTNQGDIYVSATNTFTAGVPTVDIMSAIQLQYGYSTLGKYSVPRFHRLYFVAGSYYTDATSAKPLYNSQYDTYPWDKSDLNSNRIKLIVGSLTTSTTVQFKTEGSVPEVAGTDIEFTIKSESTTNNYSIYWNCVVVKDSKIF